MIPPTPVEVPEGPNGTKRMHVNPFHREDFQQAEQYWLEAAKAMVERRSSRPPSHDPRVTTTASGVHVDLAAPTEMSSDDISWSDDRLAALPRPPSPSVPPPTPSAPTSVPGVAHAAAASVPSAPETVPYLRDDAPIDLPLFASAPRRRHDSMPDSPESRPLLLRDSALVDSAQNWMHALDVPPAQTRKRFGVLLGIAIASVPGALLLMASMTEPPMRTSVASLGVPQVEVLAPTAPTTAAPTSAVDVAIDIERERSEKPTRVLREPVIDQAPTSPAPAEGGTLMVMATGASCAFSVDGVPYGTGSSVKMIVAIGDHVVACKSHDGMVRSRIARVKAGKAAVTVFKFD